MNEGLPFLSRGLQAVLNAEGAPFLGTGIHEVSESVGHAGDVAELPVEVVCQNGAPVK